MPSNIKVGFTIEEIPVEIWVQIISLVGHSTWETLRLVNKIVAGVASSFLFAEVEVWIETQSLSRLHAISSSVELSTHVKSLVISNDYVTTKILDPRSWISSLIMSSSLTRGTLRGQGWLNEEAGKAVTEMDFNTAQQELANDYWTRENLFEAWTTQKDISIGQARLHESNKNVECLADAFQNMSNLTTILLSGPGVGGSKRLRRSGVPHFYNRGEIGRADGRQISSVLLAASLASDSASRARITSLVVDKSFWDEHRNSSITYIGTDWRRSHDFGSLSSLQILGALPFLLHITKLELGVESKSTESAEKRAVEDNLAILLAHLPALEDLTLHNSMSETRLLQKPLASIASKSLRSLKVETCLICQSDLEALLEKQLKHLKVLHLKNIGLLEGHFIDFFTSLRDSLTLEEVVVAGWLIETDEANQCHTSCDGRGFESTASVRKNEGKLRGRKLSPFFCTKEMIFHRNFAIGILLEYPWDMAMI